MMPCTVRDGKYVIIIGIIILDNLITEMANVFCAPCKTRERNSTAVNWCMECEEELCAECTDHHRSLKMLRSHHVIDLKLKTPESPLFVSIDCENHPNRAIEYFCVDHDVTCCRDCLAKEHRACDNLLSIETASEGVKQSQPFLDCNEQLKAIKHTHEIITESRKENINEMKKETERIKDEMKKVKEKLINKINEIERKMISSLDDTLQRMTNERTNELKTSIRCYESFNSYIRDMTFITEHGTEKQAFLFIHKMNKLLQDAENELQTVIPKLENTSISFEETKEDLSSVITFGSIRVKKCKYLISYKSPKSKHAQFVSRSPFAIDTYTLHNTINISFRLITGMAVTEDNKLLLCDRNILDGSYAVSVYSDTMQHIKNIKTSDRVWDITVMPKTHQAVVTNQSPTIEFIDTRTLTLGRKVNVTNAGHPAGITSTDDKIIMGDETGKIHLLNTDGESLQTLTLPSRDQTIRYISVSSDYKKIYCTTDKSVYCVKFDGTPLFSYKIPHELDHRATVTDRYGGVYVVGYNTHTVHRLRPDGTLDRVILTKEDGLSWPFSICFNRTCDRLYVFNARNYTLLQFACK